MCTRSDADEVVPGVEPVVVFPVTFSPVGTFIFIMPRIRRATNILPNATPKTAAAIKYPVELSGFEDMATAAAAAVGAAGAAGAAAVGAAGAAVA